MPDLDAIRARAEAAIKRLRRSSAQPRFDNSTALMMRDSADTLEALLAEIKRLREALGRIAHYTDRRRTGPNVEQQVACGHVAEVVSIARAALAAQESAEELPCPHARPNWRMCPHCLGVGAAQESAE